jgi:hypothetical protein
MHRDHLRLRARFIGQKATLPLKKRSSYVTRPGLAAATAVRRGAVADRGVVPGQPGPLPIDARFAQHDAETELRSAFDALAAVLGDGDDGTATEVLWSSLHGMHLLERAGRMRPQLGGRGGRGRPDEATLRSISAGPVEKVTARPCASARPPGCPGRGERHRARSARWAAWLRLPGDAAVAAQAGAGGASRAGSPPLVERQQARAGHLHPIEEPGHRGPVPGRDRQR